MSWSDIHDGICTAEGWSMLSVHSTEEQDFVGLNVMSSYVNPEVNYRLSGSEMVATRSYLGEST